MNIYLDIYGTIRGIASPIEDVVTLLEYCLDNFPGHVYWLTSYCRHGVNRCDEVLGFLPDDIRDRAIKEVKPTDWDAMKTDAIDFSQPFVWIDDNMHDSEFRVLAEHGTEENFHRINSADPEAIKNALEYIKEYSAKI